MENQNIGLAELEIFERGGEMKKIYSAGFASNLRSVIIPGPDGSVIIVSLSRTCQARSGRGGLVLLRRRRWPRLGRTEGTLGGCWKSSCWIPKNFPLNSTRSGGGNEYA